MNVIVVGGGLAGLVAAYDLEQAGIHTTVLERETRWGGQVWTARSEGFLMELGAEGYAAGRPVCHGLCRDLGLIGRLVSQLTRTSFELRDNRLVAAPPGRAAKLVGIQASRADIGQGITSLVGGMEELVIALRAALCGKADLRPSTAVQRIRPRTPGWEIATGAGDVLQADVLVLAIPATDAARLLAPTMPEAAGTLAAFRTVSSVTVSLGFQRAGVRHSLEGAGFVSTNGPHGEGFRACSFVSSQFPGRAAPGHVLLRAFFRPGPRCPVSAPDARWVDLSLEVLRPALGIRHDPLGAWVTRWPDALPRYARGQEARVRDLAERLSQSQAPLLLAGAAYRRAGVAGAIESARHTAQRILLAGKA